MKLSDAQEIINRVYTLDIKTALQIYSRGELTLAIKTTENRKSSTNDDKYRADVVFWKIVFR